MTNIRTFKQSLHDVTGHFYKEVNDLKAVTSILAYNYKRSHDKGWQNVSIPYHDVLAAIDQIDESSVDMAEIFESTKQTAILADKNRTIAEAIYIHPIEKQFERFIKGDIQEDELQEHVNRVFSVKRKVA